MAKWKTAIYLRLSSEDGDKIESDSITNQKKLITQFIKNNTDLKIVDYYVDDGYSGTDFNRPDFQRLLKDIKDGKINAVIVKDLSRFGRNYIEVGNYLEQIFPLYNLRFIAINDNVDSFKDPKSVNNVIVPFKNLMNDEYARDISNKVRSVLDTKKENGEFTGISAPYGYLKNPKDKHKFILDKYASKVVKKIFNMILNGKSREEVVDELNKCGILTPAAYKMNKNIINSKTTKNLNQWKKKTVDRILQNESYTGVLIQSKRKRISHKVHKLIRNDSSNWIIVPNHHESIISKKDFDKVQDIIYCRETRINKDNKLDLFSGYLKCKDCNNTLTIRKAKSHEYYYCTSYIKKKGCTKHSICKSKLTNIVLEVINKQIEMLINIEKEITNILNNSSINYDIEIINIRIKEIQEEINKYQMLKEEIKDDFKLDIISEEEYKEYKNEYNSYLRKLNIDKKNNENKLEKIGCKSANNKNWINEFEKNRNINNLSKKVLDELVEYIYIYDDGKIEVNFKYQDEYNEAIDFINKYKYDIIEKVLS